MNDLKDKTVKGVKWNAIGRFSTQGVNFIIGLILARLLSPSDYGVVGMVGIFFAIAQTFIDSGFGSALIRKLDCDENDYSTAFYFNIVVAIICGLILILVSPFIADFFNTPILKSIVKVMSLNMMIGSCAIVHGAKLSAKVDFKSQAKISLFTAVISGVAGVFMAYNGLGVWSLVFQNLIATIVRVICLFVATQWVPMRIFSGKSFQYLFNFGSKILAASLLQTIYANMTTLIIGKFYSAKDLGYYTRGEALANFPSTNITGIIQSVTYPVLSKMQDNDARLIASYRKLISMTSMIIFFGMFLLAAIAKPLIITLLTEKWIDSVIYLQVFCFGYMFDHICSLNLNILYVKGYSNLFLRLEIIKKAISISMTLAAIPFGVLAICISRVLYTQIAVFINTYYTDKFFGLGYLKQIRDFIKYLVCSAISSLPAFLLTFTDLSEIVQLIVGIIMALVVYTILLYRDNYFHDMLDIVKKELFINRL